MAEYNENVLVTGSLTAVVPVTVTKARKGKVTISYLGTTAELEEGDTVNLHARISQ